MLRLVKDRMMDSLKQGLFWRLTAVHSNACLNKWVFRPTLKPFKFVDLRKYSGRWFHSTGAAAEKDRPPVLARLTFLVDNKHLCLDLRCLLGTYSSIIDVMYFDASPCKALNVNRHILKVILYRTGNQCNWCNNGITWSRLLFLSTSLAALFFVASGWYYPECRLRDCSNYPMLMIWRFGRIWPNVLMIVDELSWV